MALSSALSTAISGLTSHQTAMDTIGNNLANLSTTAYKGSTTQFSTLLSQTISGGMAPTGTTGSINPVSVGTGAQVQTISTDYTQGSLESTGNVRDMAIDGNGYFVLRSGNSYVYTRDGEFYIGSDGSLLAEGGYYVQGITADENGEISENAEIENVIIPIGDTGGATETSEVSFTGNLYSQDEVAEGVSLIGGAINDADVASYLGSTTTDTSWDAINGVDDAIINGGSVQTSAVYSVYNTGTLQYESATMATDLADLYYQTESGEWVQPFSGITDGETITISFTKGEVDYAYDFTYDSTAGTNTLQSLMEFLAGDVDNVADVTDVTTLESDVNTNTSGGVMGLIDVSGDVSTDNGGTSSYDVPIETGGAFTRTISDAVDFDGDSVYDDALAVSIVSNLGADSSISDIVFSYNSVNYSDMFSEDTDYGDSQGNSTSTTITVYDSLGNEQNITVTLVMVEQDDNFTTWRWYADSDDDSDADYQVDSSGNITSSMSVGTGTIRFDSDGNYVADVETSETGGITITLDDQGVGDGITVSMTNGADTEDQSLSFADLTMTNSDYTFNLSEQNGSAPGTLDSFTVTSDGIIQGVYSNGVVETIAQLVLALVPNEGGMVSLGNNIYTISAASGDAQIALANTGGRGTVESGYLESSNVDMSEEFTALITIERGYQANARVVTTADEMLQELLNLKR